MDPPDHYHRLADENLARWRSGNEALDGPVRIESFAEDWGAVALRMTRRYGLRFAVLNMANAFVPGGAYVEGAAAQEENMFRRTDCHLRVGGSECDEVGDRYVPEMTRLLSADRGAVYLDLNRPRVCIHGPEDRGRADLGYAWLAPDEVFSFFELRASAQDLRDGSPFDPGETHRRISAQLVTTPECAPART